RDGLKPSQRRILLAMNDLNLSPGSAHRKCAKICGDCHGNYHPHGAEQVIYPTLVRMAQPFAARYPLIDPQGNFGTQDGHPPGAPRYTEARLSPYAMEMLADLDLDTVDRQPNFDETRTEPVVLPARLPNLIVNGSAGIGVALATDIPPHNLNEVCDAIAFLIDHPDATVKQLMRRIQGPDFPTAGLIVGVKGIQQAYETGRGTIVMQARAVIEPLSGGRSAILITEMPYQTSKTTLLEQIVNLVQTKRLDGVATVRDETDRKGMRVVIELRREANPSVVLNQLYKRTLLRTSYSFNMVALKDGAPRTLTLKDILQAYIDHRKEVIVRRTRFLLKKAEDRAHIVEGLIRASDHIDEVISLIRGSENRTAAREALQKRFKFTERQAQAIIEMVLGQLTGLDQQRLRAELKGLKEEIARLTAILGDPQKVLEIIKEDLRDLKRRLGDERRTVIVPTEADDIKMEDLIAQEDMTITITRDGYIKRLPVDTYRVQRRGGRGILALTKKEEDTVEHLFIATTHHLILFFTNQGRVYRLKAYEVPMASRQARGTPIVNMLQLESGEHVTAVVPVKGFSGGGYLVMATEKGVVKKTELEAFDTPLKSRGIIAITIDKGDALRWVRWTNGKRDVLITTRLGQTVRFSEHEVRPMGRTARGVIGARLRKGDYVVSMDVVEPKDKRELLVVTELGLGKRTPLKEYPRKGRGTLGVKTVQITDRNGPVVGVEVVQDDDELMVLTSEGVLIRMPVANIRQTGRAAQGVKLVALVEGAVVRAAEKVVRQSVEDS
ncbi:MAG: DNA gyrase subunit A, partial [Armatimonadota bacterium]